MRSVRVALLGSAVAVAFADSSIVVLALPSARRFDSSSSGAPGRDSYNVAVLGGALSSSAWAAHRPACLTLSACSSSDRRRSAVHSSPSLHLCLAKRSGVGPPHCSPAPATHARPGFQPDERNEPWALMAPSEPRLAAAGGALTAALAGGDLHRAAPVAALLSSRQTGVRSCIHSRRALTNADLLRFGPAAAARGECGAALLREHLSARCPRRVLLSRLGLHPPGRGDGGSTIPAHLAGRLLVRHSALVGGRPWKPPTRRGWVLSHLSPGRGRLGGGRIASAGSASASRSRPEQDLARPERNLVDRRAPSRPHRRALRHSRCLRRI